MAAEKLSDAELKKQVLAVVMATKALADTVRELGSVPSGHLYARVMSVMSLTAYTGSIKMLKDAGLVTENDSLLTWVGPKGGDS